MAEFWPPHALTEFEAWKRSNEDRFGPEADWAVDVGRAADGGTFARVWVPEALAE